MDREDPGSEETGRRDADDEADILPIHRRLGLWCAMFPGCGALLVGVMILVAVLMLQPSSSRMA
jgi:hypothetical protein